MPSNDEPAVDVIGDAIAVAVRRAVDRVGRAPLAEIGGGDSGTEGNGAADPEADWPPLVPGDPESDDPYLVLGVGHSAPWAQIVAAHKRLARTWHPDAGGDDDRIRRLNAAYAELRIRRGK